MLWVTLCHCLHTTHFFFFFLISSGTRKGSMDPIYTRFNYHKTSTTYLFSNNICIFSIKSADCQGRTHILLCPFCFHYHTALSVKDIVTSAYVYTSLFTWLNRWNPFPWYCHCSWAWKTDFLFTPLLLLWNRYILYTSKNWENLTLPGDISGGNFCAHALWSLHKSHSFGYEILFSVMSEMYVPDIYKTVVSN